VSHDHGRTSHRRPLTIAFTLVSIVMVVEVVAGWWTGSLALISDAGHMATDALGLGMALAAMMATEKATVRGGQTYGLYRGEILAALANAILLFLVGGYVLWEAAKRLGDPPEILTGPMLVVAIVGLAVNVVSWRMLRSGAKESLNVKGAYLEVLADLIGSVAVIAAAIVISLTGWTIVDPILGAGIGLFILPRAWRLGSSATRILIQAAPPHLDLEGVSSSLQGIEGVVDVHDLHVWTLTSEMDVGTVHLMTKDSADPHPVLDEARAILKQHGVAHATLQVEPESHQGCSEVTW
jgi:cobalt-zinc-cadmium efflux system protein